MVKHCAWSTCNSDSCYPERLINSEGKCVQFYHFPSFKKEKMRREAWIRACCRGDNFVCTKHSYICGLHFIGNNGPTDEHPDPIPDTANREKVRRYTLVRKNMHLFIVLFTYLATPFAFYDMQVERLNNKRNAPIERKIFAPK